MTHSCRKVESTDNTTLIQKNHYRIVFVFNSKRPSRLFSSTPEEHIELETGILLKIGIVITISRVFHSEQHAAISTTLI
jgi:hypothetical protein